MKDINYKPLIQYFLYEHPFATVITVLFLIAVVVFFTCSIMWLRRITSKR